MLSRCCFYLLALFVLSACVASSRLDVASIDSLSVNPNVAVKSAHLFGGWETFFSMATDVQRGKDGAYAADLASKKIDVGKIVYEEFQRALAQDSWFQSKLSAVGRYQLVIEVPTHALVQKNTFSDQYKPTIQIAVKILDPDGKTVYSDNETSCIFSDCINVHSLDEVKSNPELLVEQYKQASRDAIRQILEKLPRG